MSTSDLAGLRLLAPPSTLRGANGIAFGPDGRLYVAQYLAGAVSAVDVAGGATEPVLPEGSPVRSPDDLAFAADGALYITDLNPGRVWRLGPDGALSVVAEGLRRPNGITCVGNRLFVNEMHTGGRLLELFPDGGAPVELAGGLAMGNAMQLGPDGRLYYPHMLTGEVWRVPLDGGAPEQVAEQVHEPVAVRFDRTGELVVLSRGPEGIVTRFAPDGTRAVSETGVPGMDNAAFDAENRMLVSSFAASGITLVEPAARRGGRRRAIAARGFHGPFGIAADPTGRVYAADHFRLGTASGDCGPEAGGPLLSQLGGPVHGVATGGGLVHLSSQFGDVRSWDPGTGTVQVRARGLAEPFGLAVEADGSLLVAEAGAGRVVRIAPDDGLGTAATGLGRPVDVAIDAAGERYAADEELGQVVRLGADGTEVLAADLDRPHGITASGGELFIAEVGRRRVLALDVSTSDIRVVADGLPIGAPPGSSRAEPEPMSAPGVPGHPRAFTGLATRPDGGLLLTADRDATVLEL